jgi:hypothetical protein
MVRIRDDEGRVMPGVRIKDHGPKVGGSPAVCFWGGGLRSGVVAFRWNQAFQAPINPRAPALTLQHTRRALPGPCLATRVPPQRPNRWA